MASGIKKNEYNNCTDIDLEYDGKVIKGSIGVDMQGRIVFRSYLTKTVHELIPELGMEKPFKDINFITIDKHDVDNIISMLEEAMEKIGGKNYNDVEVFGDRAISYERLYDYMDRVTYNVEEKKDDN